MKLFQSKNKVKKKKKTYPTRLDKKKKFLFHVTSDLEVG